MKYCTNCGCEISNKPNFCPSCGAKISYVESTQGPEENIKSDSADSPNKTNSKPDYNSYETVFKQSYKPTKIEKKYGAVIIAISVFLVISMIVAVTVVSR